MKAVLYLDDTGRDNFITEYNGQIFYFVLRFFIHHVALHEPLLNVTGLGK